MYGTTVLGEYLQQELYWEIFEKCHGVLPSTLLTEMDVCGCLCQEICALYCKSRMEGWLVFAAEKLRYEELKLIGNML